MLYNETIIAENMNGNTRYLSRHKEGMYERPIFQRVYDSKTGAQEPIAKVLKSEVVYEIPYSPEAVKEILQKDQFDTTTSFILDLGNRQYTVQNKESFISKSVDELMREIEQYY